VLYPVYTDDDDATELSSFELNRRQSAGILNNLNNLRMGRLIIIRDILKEILGSLLKWGRAFSSGRNFVQNSELGKMSSQHIDRRERCRLSSTDDRRLFITLSDHFCEQHDGRDAVPDERA